MKNVNKFLMSSLILIALSGCNKKLSYSYLMQHPDVLKQKIADCQSTDEKSKEEIKECEIVLYAAANMVSLINEQREDPEKFGLRILNIEIAYMKAKEELRIAQQAVIPLQHKKAMNEELQPANKALDQAQKSYLDKREELRVLLAVMGLNSPD
jgi:hypothetical protein